MLSPTPAGEPEPQPDENAETPLVDTSDAAAANQEETAEATARAMRLLDELRQTISEIGPQSAVDLSGVISDLEVAVHPPGAMAADDVAELRDALLAARERPRDIDTIVDLTKRIDAMLALVIAYDRTIAAIERSLDALRAGRGLLTEGRDRRSGTPDTPRRRLSHPNTFVLAPWQCLYFLPLPHGQGSLTPILRDFRGAAPLPSAIPIAVALV